MAQQTMKQEGDGDSSDRFMTEKSSDKQPNESSRQRTGSAQQTQLTTIPSRPYP